MRGRGILLPVSMLKIEISKACTHFLAANRNPHAWHEHNQHVPETATRVRNYQPRLANTMAISNSSGEATSASAATG